MKTANLSINCKRELDTDILYARFPNCPQTDLLYIKRFWNETSVMAKTFLIFLTISDSDITIDADHEESSHLHREARSLAIVNLSSSKKPNTT